MLSKEEDDLSEWGSLVKLIKAMLAGRVWKIGWRRRTANGAAHSMAKLDVNFEVSKVWGESPPDAIIILLSDELLNFE